MEREILFRGKRTDNGEWIEGDLIHLPLGIAILANGYAYIDSDTVGQYTGLKDKNGRKIFEGDVIKESRYGETYCVIWENGGFWCSSANAGRIGRDICDFVFDYTAEVVGNIHDSLI